MHVSSLTGKEAEARFDEISAVRISVFREFPYLYDGNLSYEREYLSTYFNSNSSRVFVVEDVDTIVGVSTCIALKDEWEDFQKPFIDAEIDPSDIFYFGESVLEKKYRGKGIGKKFFSLREEHARQFAPRTQFTAFCAVDRPLDHPLAPKDYLPLTDFWNSMGYQMNQSLVAQTEWKDIDKEQPDKKPLTFWMKKWI